MCKTIRVSMQGKSPYSFHAPPVPPPAPPAPPSPSTPLSALKHKPASMSSGEYDFLPKAPTGVVYKRDSGENTPAARSSAEPVPEYLDEPETPPVGEAPPAYELHRPALRSTVHRPPSGGGDNNKGGNVRFDAKTLIDSNERMSKKFPLAATTEQQLASPPSSADGGAVPDSGGNVQLRNNTTSGRSVKERVGLKNIRFSGANVVIPDSTMMAEEDSDYMTPTPSPMTSVKTSPLLHAAASTKPSVPRHKPSAMAVKKSTMKRPVMRMSSNPQTDDLAQLEVLDADHILKTLKLRHDRRITQTYISDILISFNPYQETGQYTDEYHSCYTNVKSRHDNEPHIFWIADKAFQMLRETQNDQVILVSGESGSGKTESTKNMIKHFTYISKSDTGYMHDRIVMVNPLLEAFGNAQTLFNKNSSRFGKLIELSFTPNGRLITAQIIDYLLEKSRVVHQPPTDRNFHMFYYLFAGMPSDKLKNYYLENATDHIILTCGGKRVFEDGSHNKSCKKMFREIEIIFDKLGFTEDDVDTIYTCLAAVLHITNIDFVDASTIDETADGAVLKDEYPLRIVSDLLQVDVEVLTTAFISTTSNVSGETVVALKSVDQARDVRDALAKMLYVRLFGWIVRQINTSLEAPDPTDLYHARKIGILDFAGFENFDTENGFEQFCINIANEQLQNFFNQSIFAKEQEQYTQEGVDWTRIEFPDNTNILNMFLDRPTGILELLDEESRFPKATYQTLISKCRDYFGDGGAYRTIPGDDSVFCIRHYADDVVYNATDFLPKNRDTFSTNVKECMLNSENEFINDLFNAELGPDGNLSRTHSTIRHSTRRRLGRNVTRPTGGGDSQARGALMNLRQRRRMQNGDNIGSSLRTKTTMSQYFRTSLKEMMKKLQSSNAFFVRCIKPNDNQVPNVFKAELVERQLQYNGVLELAKIRKVGFPVRMHFRDFVDRYKLAAPQSHARIGSLETCQAIMSEHCGNADYVLGNNKVFMKDYVPDKLRLVCEMRAALMLQALIRCRLAKEKYEEKKRKKEEREKKLEEERERKLKEKRRKEEDSRNQMMAAQKDNQPEQQNSPVSDGANHVQHPSYDNHITKAPPKPRQTPSGGHNGIAPPSLHSSEDVTPSESEEEEEDVYEEEEIYTGLREDWDIGLVVPRESRPPSETFEGVLRLLKVLLYLFIFLWVLGSTTASQASVLVLTTNLLKTETSRNSVLYQLMAIMLVPQIIIVVFNFVQGLFGRTPWPSFGLTIGMVIVETLHVVGLNLLVFRVMPRFSTVYALGLMYAVAVIPGLLKLTFATSSGGVPKQLFTFLADCIAVLVQLGAVAVTILIWYFKLGVYSYGPLKMPSDIVELPVWNDLFWQIPMALVLTSIKWWENYVDTDRGFLKLFQTKKHIQLVRNKLSIITAVWNIVITILFVYLLEWLEGRRLGSDGTSGFFHYKNESFADANNVTQIENSIALDATVISIAPAIVQVVLALIGYYFAALATQLLMQRFSYWLPVVLSAPALATLITLQCEGYIPLIPATAGLKIEPLCEDWVEGTKSWYMTLSIAWWLSCLWISIHTFFPRIERLARHEKIFVTPLYVGPLVTQSFLLNRRRNQQEVKKGTLGNYEFVEVGTTASGISGNSSATSDYASRQNLYQSIQERKLAGRKAVPVIYACATMWHESVTEMKQLLKSIIRMDADQSARKLAVERLKITDPDYYEFEAHVFFDDAFEADDEDRMVPNKFVRDLVANIDEAASAVMEVSWTLRPPTKIATPYGGKLVWTLPGKNLLIVHLKDKDKIRHKKRWSQVMYMYYLLGYRLFGSSADFLRMQCFKPETTKGIADKAKKGSGQPWEEAIAKTKAHFGKSSIFDLMEDALLSQAENTFLLALDGDVDFRPEAVRLLLDQMRKNPKTGAACGRIHPIGQGPMVWYQQFEYAIGHWFQKATEHVLGCVLCSPGCFSMFRGSAIMDDNVMKRYTEISTEPVHFLQYDQGEDRWLCTLLLQQGYRVDYTAASDALTYAPETFNEFFNQRRRWVPSTMANVMDLLSDYKNTVIANDNISYLYMMYQFALMVSTILGPSTIVLAIANALWNVLQVELWVAYLLSVIPVAFYLAICFTTKQPTQLLVGALLSVIYSCIMVVVLVGIIQTLVTDGILNPSLTFLVIVAICFIVAGILHPYEISDLPSGLLYYLCIPAGYLILMIYSLCNMHVISWGTREVASKKTKAQREREAAEAAAKQAEAKKKKKGGFFGWFNRENLLQDVKDIIGQVFSNRDNKAQEEQLKFLKKIHEDLKRLNNLQSGHHAMSSSSSDDEADVKKGEKEAPSSGSNTPDDTLTKKKKKEREVERAPPQEDPYRPKWVYDPDMGFGPVEYLDYAEEDFWVQFIKKYLKPLKKNAAQEAKVNAELKSMRTNASFGFWFINILWIIFNFMIQRDDRLSVEVFGQDTQPQGLVFLVFFILLLVLQLICMFIHRWETFLQVISITDLRKVTKKWLKKTKGEQLSAAEAIEFSRELQKPMSMYIRKPLADYDIEDRSSNDSNSTTDTDRLLGRTGIRRRQTKADVTKPEKIHEAVKNHLKSFRLATREGATGAPPALPPRGDIEAAGTSSGGATGHLDGPVHPLARAIRKTQRALQYNRDAEERRMTRKTRDTRFIKKSKHARLTQKKSAGLGGAEGYNPDNALEKYFDNRIDQFL